MSNEKAQRQEAETFIDHHPLAVVAIDRKRQAPYAAAVFIVRDDDLNLYFITKTETEKYKALKERDQVSVTISDFHAQKTIQAEGTANEITADGTLTEEIFKKLAHIKPPGNMNWLPPIIKLKAGDYAVIQIEISKMRLANYVDALSTSPQQAFHHIIG